MHPHVVISGIASLFPKDDKKRKTEAELNDPEQVNIVDHKVLGEDRLSPMPSPSGTSTPDASSLASARSPSPSLSPRSTRTSSPLELLDKTSSFITKLADEPMVKFFRKHSDEPFSAMKRWVVEHFEFGQCMFEPSGLLERYRALEAWNGLWVNYWTETVPKPGSSASIQDPFEKEGTTPSLTTADMGRMSLEDTGGDLGADACPLTKEEEKERSKQLKKAEKELKKQRDIEKKAQESRPPRHFIVLPGRFNGHARHKWLRVPIAGAEDEVQAHCGLFIKDQNLDYEAFVDGVGDLLRSWCRLIAFS
ncbi:hypothetical protein GLOTRDRAFT_111670 [Gloeophyllum trabeum ATCC 11539]|uniref:Uncharacterized protein n=1 Tax=Gloeophyllum trabeum (strain ATCC 11539 / FP-39264 / Madison 617) TaxID=670483 RepID=S7RGW1_GLOTA|nr:uncharacterized protein GLOTRDRAFT_111670 [Gloeophyllum trabeum ATCC 11539]EPQ53450.1 hypothetical protein GLOTRDRAFT_111670 [Gloeophyllum trabeum ATCC 11539]